MAEGAVSNAALDRLGLVGSQEFQRNTTQLALTPYEYGLDPGGINNPPYNPALSPPGTQDAHPSAQRLASAQMGGKTSQLNHAQAAQDGAPVWVTVPVDKVTVAANGSASVNPVYASTRGYIPRPGESRGSIPPTGRAGKPF